MVITKDEFEKKKMDASVQKVGKNQVRILELLRQNPEEAWSQAEIQLELGIEHMSAVNYALHSLRKKGLIISKIVKGTIYWKVNNAARVSKVISNNTGPGQEASDGEEE